MGRLELQDANSQVIRVRETEQIALAGSEQPRVKDIAWTSTTTIAVLSMISPKLFSVQTVAVDGAPTDTTSTTITGEVTGLAGTPVPDSRQYAVTPNSADRPPDTQPDVPRQTPIASLGYVG